MQIPPAASFGEGLCGSGPERKLKQKPPNRTGVLGQIVFERLGILQQVFRVSPGENSWGTPCRSMRESARPERGNRGPSQ